MGSFLENVFAQAIKSNGFLNYFDSKKYGELDFVIQKWIKGGYSGDKTEMIT